MRLLCLSYLLIAADAFMLSATHTASENASHLPGIFVKVERGGQVSESGEQVVSGVWNSLEQTDWDTMCYQGRQLPQLYLLGAAKASTTTLAHELMHAGVKCVHDHFSTKEFHFFDGIMNWNYKTNEDFEAQKTAWLQWMPFCPNAAGEGKRRLLADFTPDYLRMVTLPPVANRFGTFPPWGDAPKLGTKNGPDVEAVHLPGVLHKFYGEGASRRLSFVVLLREPLARMQSAWYHAQSFNFTNLCVDCRADSFQEAFQNHMGYFTDNPRRITDWIWQGMYAWQLDGWLATFKPDQFLLIPYKYLESEDKDNICLQISKHIDFDMNCDSQHKPISHEWSHEHPPLEQDVQQYLRKRFDTEMKWHQNLLVTKLAKGLQHGMVLANYSGPEEGDNVQHHINNWLEKGW